MNREVKTDLYDVLGMICTANDYGHNGQIAMAFLFGLTGDLTKEEIETYCREEFLSDEAQEKGYGEEDYESVKEIITEFAKQYNKLKQ